MRRVIMASGALLQVAGGGLARADDAFGIWARGDGIARVRIAPCGSVVCATNVWVNDPSGDEKVGDKLVLTVQRQPDGLVGKAFDPKRNLTFSFDLKVAGDRMTTRGCLAAGLVCKSFAWTRLAADRPN